METDALAFKLIASLKWQENPFPAHLDPLSLRISVIQIAPHPPKATISEAY